MSISDRIFDIYANKGKDYDEEDFYLYVRFFEKEMGGITDPLRSISNSLEEGDNEHAAWNIFHHFVEDIYLWPLFHDQNVKKLNKDQRAEALDEISDFWDFVSNFKWCSKPMKTVKIINDEVKDLFFKAVEFEALELGHYESEDSKEKLFKKYLPEILTIFGQSLECNEVELKKHLQIIARKAVWLKHYEERLTEEARLKLSEAHKDMTPWIKGKHHTEEACLKISAANKGRTRSEETRAKMSAAHKGKHHSEETKAKIGAGHKGRRYHTKRKNSFSVVLNVPQMQQNDENRNFQ